MESFGLSTNENIKALYRAGAELFLSSANLSNNLKVKERATIRVNLVLSLIPFFKRFNI